MSGLADMRCCSVCEIDGIALATCPSCQALLCPSCKIAHACGQAIPSEAGDLATEKTQPGTAILSCPCGASLLSRDSEEQRKFAEEHMAHAEAGPT